MAKSQTNASTGAAQNLITQANTQLPPVIQGIQGQQQNALNTQNSLLGNALSGYTQQQATGGYDPTQLSNLRTEFANLAPTGGYDPAQLAQITGGYGNLATTGGFTPGMQQQFLQQATSGLGTTASNLSSAAQRNAAATGGNAQAALSNIQTQLGEQQAPAVQNAMLGLNQQITANQLSGLGGLQGTEAGLASARQGVGGLQAGLESGVAGGVQGANAGISGLYNTQTGQVTALGNQILAGLGLQYGTEAQGASILQALSKNPGFFQTMLGDLTSAGGAAAGAYAGITGCWIAEAIYGSDDIRTHILRAYLNGPFKKTLFGRMIMWLYFRFGRAVARKVRKHGWLKRLIKPIFDNKLRSAGKWLMGMEAIFGSN